MCSSTPERAGAGDRADSPGRDYLVTGMTCQSCATKVTSAIERVDGVAGVSVDLAAGRLTVIGNADDNAIHGAVTGAGYQISTA